MQYRERERPGACGGAQQAAPAPGTAPAVVSEDVNEALLVAARKSDAAFVFTPAPLASVEIGGYNDV